MASVGVSSLRATMEFEIRRPIPRVLPDDVQQISSIVEILDQLQIFLRRSYIKAQEDDKIKSVEVKIKDFAIEAENKVELQLRTILLERDSDRKEESRRELHRVLEDIGNEVDKLWKIVKPYNDSLAADSLKLDPGELDDDFTEPTRLKDEMVGHRDELNEILEILFNQSNKERQITSVAGMGGIGKTILARTVYDFPKVTTHFDIRAWTTVAQQTEMKQVIIALLRCIKTMTPEEIRKASKDELAEQLQKLLKGRRYLIVVDDLWGTEAWDDIQRCFPAGSEGSRILLTTRIKVVADYTSPIKHFDLQLLDSVDSWTLFSRNPDVGKRLSSTEFKEVGEEIVKRCKGLPLSIVVVAGILSSKTLLDEWKGIQNELQSVLSVDEQCSKIVALSYKHLPPHLRSCFLHLGVFPEDSEMPIKNLVRLWIAEGFVKLDNGSRLEDVKLDDGKRLVDAILDNGKRLVDVKLDNGKRLEDVILDNGKRLVDVKLEYGKRLEDVKIDNDKRLVDMKLDNGKRLEDVRLDNGKRLVEVKLDDGKRLEDVAFEYLQDLVRRSIVLVRHWSSNGKIKTCSMHDLMHEFCVSNAENENYLYAGSMRRFRRDKDPDDKSKANDGSVKREGFRWLSFWPNYGNVYFCYNLDKSRSLSFLHRDAIPTLIGQCLPSNLLRVLDLIQLPPLSNGVFRNFRGLVLLRYMDITLDDYLSPEELTNIAAKTQNLQTLVVSLDGTNTYWIGTHLPSKIWESPQLRHLEVSYALSVDPPSEVNEGLHTLYWLSLDHCTEEVFSRIPNVKKLGIICRSESNPDGVQSNNLENLGCLDKLETLMIAFRKDTPSELRFQNLNSLPLGLNIKKLKLKRTCLPWSEINDVIGKLPCLEVLKLKEVSNNEEWMPNEENVSGKLIKCLYLESRSLANWEISEDEAFPCLERLVLKRCMKLKEIPAGFASCIKLELIELRNCSPEVLASAKKLNETREGYGYEDIAVRHVDQIQEGVDDEDDDDSR